MKYLQAILILLTSLVLSVPGTSFGQNNVQKIAVYTRVWGFIKYHHSGVANGHLNWDSVFLAHLDQVIHTSNGLALNAEVTALLTAAGPVYSRVAPEPAGQVFKANFDLSWLQGPGLLSQRNKEKLLFIYHHRNQDSSRFIRRNNQSDFSGENQYADITSPNAKYRLLFLARFWNVINYFDPYKYLAGQDWNRVLECFIPRFYMAGDRPRYYKTLLALSASLHNGHSYVSINGTDTAINHLVYGRNTAPFYPEIVDGVVLVRKVLNDSLCQKAGIAQGDIVLGIGGVLAIQKINEMRAYVSGSNEGSQNTIISWRLFDTDQKMERLKIKRGQRIINTTVQTVPVESKSWQDINNYTANGLGYKMVGHSIAYVYAAQITNSNLDSIRRLILKSKAVIFDVRNYPWRDDFFNVMGMMLPGPKYINYSTVFIAGNPGRFSWQPSNKIGELNSGYYKGKTIILADERTQSQGEYSVMVLQTIPGALTLGSQTAGADGAVSPFPMGGKITIGFSGYGVYYPDKTPTQRVGVKIDIVVKKTAAAAIKGRDLAAERALQYLAAQGIQ